MGALGGRPLPAPVSAGREATCLTPLSVSSTDITAHDLNCDVFVLLLFTAAVLCCCGGAAGLPFAAGNPLVEEVEEEGLRNI